MRAQLTTATWAGWLYSDGVTEANNAAYEEFGRGAVHRC